MLTAGFEKAKERDVSAMVAGVKSDAVRQHQYKQDVQHASTQALNS